MSERKINLEEILKKHVDITSEDITEIGMFNWVAINTRKEDVISAMKEACRQALELAAENVHLNISHETPTSGEYSNCEQSFYFNERCGYKYNVKTDIKINKKSILDTINQIE